jgi:hypothetical protein
MLYSTSLESYIKAYEPVIYETLIKDGVDIKELESLSPNKNQEDKSPTDKSISLASIPIIERVKSCEENDGVYLNNKIISTCVSKDGTFGNGHDLVGMTFEGADFLRPGSPYEYFSVRFDGTTYHNNNSYGYGLGAIGGGDTIKNTKIKALSRSASDNGGAMVYSLITEGECPYDKGLKIVQKYTLDPNSKEIIIRVEMSNIGWLPIHDLYYARGLDPDPDIQTYGSFGTYNQKGGDFGTLAVSPQNLVQATGTYSKLAVGLYSVDDMKHNTCISSYWSMEPTDTISCTTPNQPYADHTIGIAFELDSLYPGQKKVFSFKYLFEKKPLNPILHDVVIISDAKVAK